MNEIPAEPIQRHITAEGQIRPERAATLRASGQQSEVQQDQAAAALACARAGKSSGAGWDC